MTQTPTPTGVYFELEGGHVAASIMGDAAWIHDLEVEGGDPKLAARLCLAARAWIRSQGYQEFFVWVSPDSPMKGPLLRSGFTVEHLILRSK